MVKTRPFLSHLTRHTWPFWTSNRHISIQSCIRQQYPERDGGWGPCAQYCERVMRRRRTTHNENAFSEELKGAFGSRRPSDRKGRDGASPPSTQRRVDVA